MIPCYVDAGVLIKDCNIFLRQQGWYYARHVCANVCKCNVCQTFILFYQSCEFARKYKTIDGIETKHGWKRGNSCESFRCNARNTLSKFGSGAKFVSKSKSTQSINRVFKREVSVWSMHRHFTFMILNHYDTKSFDPSDNFINYVHLISSFRSPFTLCTRKEFIL